MHKFLFKAKRANGQVISGNLKAKTKNDVIYLLKSKNLEPIKIDIKKSVFQLGSGGSTIPAKSLVTFTRQMSFLINAGIPVVQALQIVKEISSSIIVKEVVADVMNSIEKGSTFADALAAHPGVFNNVFVNIIQSGEIGGSLDIMLNRLALYIEENEQLKSRVKKAMMYPAFLLTIGTIIIIIIMVKVVPQFTSIFDSASAELPAMTQLLITISDFFISNFIVLIIGVFFVPFCFIMYLRSPAGRVMKDQLLMFTPIIGPLLLKSSFARFSRTLSCLLSGGVNVADALGTASLTANNFFVEKAINNVRNKVIKGKSVAHSLKQETIFPGLVSNMMAIGEETGNTDATLEKVAEFYEEQVKTTTAAISDLLQPVLIAILGCVVGFIVIALYLPIFKLPGVMM